VKGTYYARETLPNTIEIVYHIHMDYHFRQVERLYQATESCEIGAQLINVHLRRGGSLQDLRGKFPATLLWDARMGYDPGRTEKLVTSATVQLEAIGWRSEAPEILLVGDEQLFFRAVWSELEIPFLMDNWRLSGEKQTLLLEDAPQLHLDPVINITNIKVAGSGGRQSPLWRSTKRVPFTDPVASFPLLQECAYNIFHGSLSGPEQEQYGGGGIYGSSS